MNRRQFIKNIGLCGAMCFVPVNIFAQNPPKILIIGDSISIGYTPFVMDLLNNKANVEHNKGNAGSTWMGLNNIDSYISAGKWDLIHFNWGLWDLCYRNPSSENSGNRDRIKGNLTTSIQQYRKNLEIIVNKLSKTKAKLIWATTTPVPAGEPGRFEGDSNKYNNIAIQLMVEKNIPINDLYSFIKPELDKFQITGDVHFTGKGYKYLATKVYQEIINQIDAY